MLKRVLTMLVMVSLVIAALVPPAMGVTWQMKQHDMHNTGRADYTVSDERLNNTFFDVFLWQKPSPGPVSSTSMAFYDGVGPQEGDIIIGTYHWPKGILGMDRHTGSQFWAGNPSGGETIGLITPAFSNDGSTIYVVNDATPNPLMAFQTTAGPATFWHNGANPNPDHLSMYSPTIAPDGRIFLHSWCDRPYAGNDNGTAITETWAAATSLNSCYSDPALYIDGGNLKVISGDRTGNIKAYDGATGSELWGVNVGALIDASLTIDPTNGNIYVGAGENDIYVAGLDKDGQALWGSASKLVYNHINGSNNPQRAQSTGCLSYDGSTYYFQTNSRQGDGCLYAVNAADGTLKWYYNTGSKGWEMHSSSPIVTKNGVIIIGNNEGDTYYAIKDNGTEGTLLDILAVDSEGNAQASATISPDGRLYLPLRTCWSVSNGDGEMPTNQVENLFAALDITADPTLPNLYPPQGVIAVALNNAVSISWLSALDPIGQFGHYAIYRATMEFTSVAGMIPIGIVPAINTTHYLDETAVNGISYYYAISTVSADGGKITDVEAVGPRTPRDETDLQVVFISRTPRYPRYAPIYTYDDITEPSGFGPYIFSAATGLDNGQTEETQRWPNIGDPVTYTATVRNRGTNNWDANLAGTWRIDGVIVRQQSQILVLEPGAITTFTHVLNWDGQSHEISFTIDETDARSGNNSLTIDTKSVPFLSYIDVSYIEDFREATLQYPDAVTDDFIDWLNYHMARFNEMFAEADCRKRVHYDFLEVLSDNDPDPGIDRQPFAIFPFRFYAGDPSYRQISGYYRPAEDIDYALLHEMGHQLGIIDLYQLDVPADWNQVSGLGYSGPEGLMHSCADFISEHSALAMNHWLDEAHGYYGQYMYNIPSEMRLKFLNYKGDPLVGATVKMYQYCERPGQGKVITDQIKTQGITDSSGEFVLPNVPIDPSKVPPIYTGDELHANPFGYLAVVGTNGVLLFRVEYEGSVDYTWLDITEANIAYFNGQTNVAIFNRQLSLGEPLQYCPPTDLTELNADDWDAWAQGSSVDNTYVEDDTNRKLIGDASLKFVTDGGFDTYVRYPRTFTAHWDLSSVNSLNISFYAENPNGFQNGSPWIRLKDAENNYFEYQFYVYGNPYDLLDEANYTWQSFEIPLNVSPTTEIGWRCTTVGSPDMSDIQYIEIHADTWDYGFNLWIDGVSFAPSPCPCEGDFDCDGLPDTLENSTCTDPVDADTDDDGISDGVEDVNKNGVVDPGETNPCQKDTDGDGIQDGTELGITDPVPDPDGDGPLLGTDTNIFIADADPTTKTDPVDEDSDDDGVSDGVEDANQNGTIDTGETDPSDSLSYPAQTILYLKQGFNLIAIPSEVTNQPDLKDWLPVLGDSLEIEKVMVYDDEAGKFITLIPGDTSNPSFILNGGEGLIVYARQDKEVVFTTLLCSTIDLEPGFNLVGFACPANGYSAYQLLNDLGSENVSSIQRYASDKGAFETAGFGLERQLAGVDFPIVRGEGYFVYMK